VNANLGAEHLATVLPVFRLHHEFITRFPARADSAITKDDVDSDGEISGEKEKEKMRRREKGGKRGKEREAGARRNIHNRILLTERIFVESHDGRAGFRRCNRKTENGLSILWTLRGLLGALLGALRWIRNDKSSQDAVGESLSRQIAIARSLARLSILRILIVTST